MRIVQRIKNFFKRGGYALQKEIKSINDHPKINIDPEELQRIEKNFVDYQGKYPRIEYVNSMGKLQNRDYFYLNMTKLTAEYLAGLVFNEQCEVNISDADDDKEQNTYKNAHDFISHVFEHNDFIKNLSSYLEPMYATGGIAARPYVNQLTGNIEFSWALADAFFPLKSTSNGVSEGVMMFKSMQVDGDKTKHYTLLEFHEWEQDSKTDDNLYVITNELYESDDPNVIGKRIPLNDRYKGLKETTTFRNLSRPQFNYCRPSGFNNISPHSPLGLSITDNAKPTLKKINDTYDEFYWEIKMGKRTVFVDDSILNTLPTEDGLPPKQVFDPDVNVFKSTRFRDGKNAIHDVTSDIRTEQYTSAINGSLRLMEMEMKFSPGTFSFDGRSVKTATEITSENSLTYRTRNQEVNEVEKFIKGLIVSTLELAKASKYNGKPLFNGEIPTFEHIGVDFDDGIFVDKMQQLKFLGQAKALGFIPTIEAIRRLFELPKETAEEWEKIIQDEQTVLDPLYLQQRNEEDLFGEGE